MNRKAIDQKDHVKYLGVLMDQHLSWKYQISNVSKKISRGTGILPKLKGNMNKELLVNIHYCLVFSYLSYGVEAWGSACLSDLSKINVLQKKLLGLLRGTNTFKFSARPLVLFHPRIHFSKNLSFWTSMMFTNSVSLSLCI